MQPYIKYTHYFNPDRGGPCDIFETMEHLLEQRKGIEHTA